jgi:pilus assembly protein Flp/PilA
MMTRLINLFKDEEGVTALEYGLIAALIAAFIIGAVSALGTSVSTTFQNIADAMDAAMTPAP